MARVDEQLAALATMSLTQLQAEWDRLGGGLAPVLTARLLRMAIGYRLQEKARGGLPAAIARELGRAVTTDEPPPVARVASTTIRPGTRLVRSWQGRTIDVLATEDGFLFEDQRYTSLTSIARAVTGTRWSGPRFFGRTAHA
jgi:hypothetical protein